MNLRGSVTAVALGVALLLSGCASGHPASNSEVAPSPVEAVPATCPALTAQEIEHGDMAGAAGEFVPWVDYQERFGSYASSIQAAHPDDFAAAFVEANCGRGTISFKGAVPATLAAHAPDIEGVTFVPNVGLNEAEAGELSRKVFEAAQSELGPVSMVGGFSWRDHSIDITYGPSAENVEPTAEQLASLARRLEATVPLPDGVTVSVRYTTEALGP